MTELDTRDLIIAPSREVGLKYAERNSIGDPLIVTRDYRLAGISLESHRLHMLAPFNPGVLDRLCELAGVAGQPLESFYAEV
ncbi:hypothetical protein ACFXG4_27220 [Nocardia sp. NPDC059246]|uniref:hypothetical protein n=1 Tax=unclassified Nocardia TaxID=2637762 RepID=UPI0036BB2939